MPNFSTQINLSEFVNDETFWEIDLFSEKSLNQLSERKKIRANCEIDRHCGN